MPRVKRAKRLPRRLTKKARLKKRPRLPVWRALTLLPCPKVHPRLPCPSARPKPVPKAGKIPPTLTTLTVPRAVPPGQRLVRLRLRFVSYQGPLLAVSPNSGPHVLWAHGPVLAAPVATTPAGLPVLAARVLQAPAARVRLALVARARLALAARALLALVARVLVAAASVNNPRPRPPQTAATARARRSASRDAVPLISSRAILSAGMTMTACA